MYHQSNHKRRLVGAAGGRVSCGATRARVRQRVSAVVATGQWCYHLSVSMASIFALLHPTVVPTGIVVPLPATAPHQRANRVAAEMRQADADEAR